MKAIPTIIARVIMLSLVWWAFTEGDLSGTVFGLVIVALVTFVSLRLFPAGSVPIRPLPLLVFVKFFLARSVTAGIDVARRLLMPSLPVKPGYVTVQLGLPEGGPRWLLANIVSLMPGTLSVALDGAQLRLHCLDIGEPVETDLRDIEQKVAGLFGLSLPGNSDQSGDIG